MHTLTRSHPSRRIVGAARLLKQALYRERLYGPVPYADLAEAEGQAVAALSLETASDANRLRTLMQSHAADGVITADELDEQVRLVNEIQTQALEGRIIQ